MALQSTVWVKIANLADFSSELDRIVAAIFENREKPLLGVPPSYVREPIVPISSLTDIDNLVLKLICEQAMAKNSWLVGPDELYAHTNTLEIDKEDVLDSVEVLNSRAYVKISYVLGGCARGISHFRPTSDGFGVYARAYIHNLEDLCRSVATEILNKQSRDNVAIASAIAAQKYVVEHILNEFESHNWLRLSKSLGQTVHIVSISPELKRAFR